MHSVSVGRLHDRCGLISSGERPVLTCSRDSLLTKLDHATWVIPERTEVPMIYIISKWYARIYRSARPSAFLIIAAPSAIMPNTIEHTCDRR
jgi:hypothetical protein